MPRRLLAAVLAMGVGLGTVVSGQSQLRRLYVSVTDARGIPVLDLYQFEFDVLENGASVPVERSRLSRDPLRIALLVDSSAGASGGLIDIRAGLQAFINAVPEEHEIGLITIGGQMRVRAQPDTDRTLLRKMVTEFAPDGGRVRLLDGLRETDERFMRRLEDGRWPVFVIVTTDGPEGSGSISLQRYVEFMEGMMLRGTIAHAVVVQLPKEGFQALQSMARAAVPTAGPPRSATSSVPDRIPDAGEISLNVTSNLRGTHQMLVAATALPEQLRTLGQRIVADHRLMSSRYEVDYRGSANLAVGALAKVSREGLQVISSPRRPF